MSRLILILALTISTTSCNNVKVCAQPPLPLPPPIPAEKKLNQDELQAVSDETLEKIILLDKRRKTLESIIESTHNGADSTLNGSSN